MRGGGATVKTVFKSRLGIKRSEGSARGSKKKKGGARGPGSPQKMHRRDARVAAEYRPGMT